MYHFKRKIQKGLRPLKWLTALVWLSALLAGCENRFEPRVLEDGIAPLPEEDALGVWLERLPYGESVTGVRLMNPLDPAGRLVTDTSRRTAANRVETASLFQFSLKRLEVLTGQVSLYQGEGSQRLDLLHNPYDLSQAEDQFVTAEIGNRFHIFSIDYLPDGNYTHFGIHLSAIRTSLPVKLHFAGGEYRYDELDVTFFLRDNEDWGVVAGDVLVSPVESDSTDSTATDGGSLTETGSPEIEVEPFFVDTSQLLVQAALPYSDYTLELDEAIRVTETGFGRYDVNIYVQADDFVYFDDGNYNYAVDLTQVDTPDGLVWQFNERLNALPLLKVYMTLKTFNE